MYYAGSKRKLGKKPIANIFFFTPNESSEDHSEAEEEICPSHLGSKLGNQATAV